MFALSNGLKFKLFIVGVIIGNVSSDLFFTNMLNTFHICEIGELEFNGKEYFFQLSLFVCLIILLKFAFNLFFQTSMVKYFRPFSIYDFLN